MSHDWPASIERYGDLNGLLRRKSFFKADVESGKLGSPPLMGLLMNLKPEWWFAAHLHVRFAATVLHDPEPVPSPAKNPDEIEIDDDDETPGDVPAKSVEQKQPQNPDEISLDDEEETVEAPPQPPPPARKTQFLALDKCLPKRDFLEVRNSLLTPNNLYSPIQRHL